MRVKPGEMNAHIERSTPEYIDIQVSKVKALKRAIDYGLSPETFILQSFFLKLGTIVQLLDLLFCTISLGF